MGKAMAKRAKPMTRSVMADNPQDDNANSNATMAPKHRKSASKGSKLRAESPLLNKLLGESGNKGDKSPVPQSSSKAPGKTRSKPNSVSAKFEEDNDVVEFEVEKEEDTFSNEEGEVETTDS